MEKPMEIEVIWEAAPIPEWEILEIALRDGVAAAVRLGGGPETAAVCVLVTGDARLRELNRQYRGLDQATDVLSFAMRETGPGEPAVADANMDADTDATLGDIVISLERAAAQGEEYGHGLRRELVFLAVHGALHLLGYDHGAEEDAVVMRAMEKTVMNHLGALQEGSDRAR
ncbi:MAG: rRNA maturation RNase YbeY [Gracilibacteraceae bacterium]|jgi:probable rRNA maturation factor|nr:rRNA maturation RNase YbeY [Gracilibacteraceae bacterium]